MCGSRSARSHDAFGTEGDCLNRREGDERARCDDCPLRQSLTGRRRAHTRPTARVAARYLRPRGEVFVSSTLILPASSGTRTLIHDELPGTLTTDSDWVSASATRNFLLQDPLLDWLDRFGSL